MVIELKIRCCIGDAIVNPRKSLIGEAQQDFHVFLCDIQEGKRARTYAQIASFPVEHVELRYMTIISQIIKLQCNSQC